MTQSFVLTGATPETSKSREGIASCAKAGSERHGRIARYCPFPARGDAQSLAVLLMAFGFGRKP